MRRISVFVLVLFCPFALQRVLRRMATTSLGGVVKDPTGAVRSRGYDHLEQQCERSRRSSTRPRAVENTSSSDSASEVHHHGYSSGLRKPRRRQAELLVNQPATVDFALSVKGSNEVVDVTEATQTLNTFRRVARRVDQ